MSKSIIVLGAGSVGIGCAIHLLQRGWQVTLLDRKGPGQETSYGNAGVINGHSVIPLNNPGLLKNLPKYLLNNKSQVRYSIPYLMKRLPWLLGFLKASNEKNTTQSALALRSLASGALDEHKAIMQRVGNMHRIKETGWMKLYRNSSGLDPAGFESRIFSKVGISVDRLNEDDIHQLEPSLKPVFKSGYMIPDNAHLNNPGALFSEYAEQFAKDGGKLHVETVEALKNNGNTVTVTTNATTHQCDHIVVAAGPWSDDVLNMLGYRVQLGYERGYHQHFHLSDGVSLNHSIYDIAGGYVMGPMEQGLRITTGVEINHRDAPSNYSQLKQVLPRIKEAIDIGDANEQPIWRGARPTFPDSLPVIGAVPKADNVWAAFGHQHVGMMNGPVTGKLLSQLISGEKIDIDLQPFSPDRWIQAKF
jgi:D-amino-acid dehydrogenase